MKFLKFHLKYQHTTLENDLHIRYVSSKTHAYTAQYAMCTSDIQFREIIFYIKYKPNIE